MLDIKQARPRETYGAVYVTKDNADEFYELAYGYFDKPIKIERHDTYTTYSYHERSLVIKHNCWHTADRNLWHWKCREHFDKYYEIVNEVQDRIKQNDGGKIMRNPERLDDFYKKMEELHKQYVPDWRTGQLMFNFISETGDPFYWEEDEFIKRLEQYLKEVTGK